MVAKKNTTPIRPPERTAARSRCTCGRKALFRAHRAHAKRHLHADRQHSLCKRCFRDLGNHLRAAA